MKTFAISVGLATFFGVFCAALPAVAGGLGESQPTKEASEIEVAWRYQVMMPRTGYGIFLRPLKESVPIGRVHQWLLMIKTSAGDPSSGMTVDVSGSMPGHGHGMPTRPQVVPLGVPGYYRIDGMQFSMPGEWLLKVSIASPVADAVTIPVRLD